MCRTTRRCDQAPLVKELTNARRRVARNTAKAEAALGLGLDGAEQLRRVEADRAIVGALEEALAAAGHDPIPDPPPAAPAPAPAGPPAYYDPATAPEGPATMNYLRRKGTSTAHGNFGATFGQDVEPAGRYVTQGTMQPHLDAADWDSGVVTFQNPLRLPFGDDDYTAPDNWKRALSRQYAGKTGKALSQAIRADGFDAIITWDRYGTSEIVDLTSIKPAAEKKAPAKPKAAKAPRTGQAIAAELKAEYPGLILHLESPNAGQGSPYVVLSHIEIPKAGRNSGAGTAIMERIIKEADANGWPLALTPDGAFGGSKTRLEKFYRRFGFVPNKGRNKDFLTQEAMIRQPAS
jgi:hypothetical protein